MPQARVARNLGRLVSCRYGTTENVDFGSHAAYRIGADDSAAGGAISFWFRARTTTGTPSRRLALLYTANNWVGLYMASTEGSDKSAIVAEFVRAGGGVAGVSGSTGIRYTDNKLHHCVLTWSAAGAELWMDGVLAWSAVGDARPTFGATPNLVLGNTINPYNHPASADVGGECCLFARRLTRGEIEGLYFNAESPDAPAACWGPRGWDPGGAAGGSIALTGGTGNAGVVTNGLTMPERAERLPRVRTRGRGATRVSPTSAGQSAGWVVADAAALKPQSFTIEARVRFDSLATGEPANYRGIVVKTTGISWNDGWGLVEIPLPALGARVIRLWVGGYANGTTFAIAASTRELHVAGTYDYVTGSAKIYVEGVLVHTWAAGAGLAQAAVPLRIGCGYNGVNGYTHRGTVRDVRYYSRVLSALEIAARAEQDEEIEAGLIEAWALDEAPKFSNATPLASVVAKGRVAGLNAAWENDSFAGDFEGASDLARVVKAVASRWRQAKGTDKARSAIDASLKPGSGSFSVALSVRLLDGQNNSNIVVTANDGVSYANGWALNFLIGADGTSYTISAYVNSGGPTLSTSTYGARVIPRNRTTRWVLVADAAAQTVTMYADGQVFGKATGVSWNIANNPYFAVGHDLAIGYGAGMQAGDVQYAVGTAWTAEEIAHDARGVPDSLSGVTHAWPLDEKSGSSFRATKGSVVLSTVAGAFADALSAQPAAPAPQNLLKYSEQFSNAAWVKASGVVVTDNAAVAPDGSQTACSVDATAASVATGLYEFASSRKDQPLCRSVWLKGTAGQTVSLTDPASGVTVTTITFDGSWQRVANLDPVQLLVATNNCGLWVRKGTANVWQMWGAQVVEATAPTPYVKTEDAIEPGPGDRYTASSVDGFEQRCWMLALPEDASVDGSNFVLSLPGRAPGNRSWTQGTSSKRPQLAGGGLDGHPYLLFDGGDVLQAAAPFVTDLSTATARANWLIAAVIDSSAANGSQAVFDSFESSSGDRVLVTQSGYATPGKTSWYDGTWREPANSITGPQLVLWDLRAGRGRFLRNGVPVGAEFPFTPRMMDDLGVALGGNYDAGSGYFLGKIYFAAVIKNPTDADVLATIDFARARFPSLNL